MVVIHMTGAIPPDHRSGKQLTCRGRIFPAFPPAGLIIVTIGKGPSDLMRSLSIFGRIDGPSAMLLGNKQSNRINW
jgi:hypothetical protein